MKEMFNRVCEVGSGTAALERIAAERPALLVIDRNMPGLSGVDVIRSLRGDAHTASLPILMLTAANNSQSEAESLDAGADDYIAKPVTMERLRARTRALFSARQRAAVASS